MPITAFGAIAQGVSGVLGATAQEGQAGAMAAHAQQPGVIAAVENGPFGAPAQQQLALSSQWVFENQSPAALAALTAQQPGATDLLAGVGEAASGMPAPGNSFSMPWWGWALIVVVAIWLLRGKH